MSKHNDNLEAKERLKKVEELIDGGADNQKVASSFLGFCSRLLSVRPKADARFQSSLKRELLGGHPAYAEKDVESRDDDSKINKFVAAIRGLSVMIKTKRSVSIGASALLIAGVLLFSIVISPGMQIANAVEVIANDPQVRAVIEEYDLEVQFVEIRDNVAYIFLDKEESKKAQEVEVVVTVNLNEGTIGKIVTENEKTLLHDIDGVERSREFEAKAEAEGMTVEEFKKHLLEQKKANNEIVEEKAAAKGMSTDEFKKHVVEQYEAKARAKGMTVEELEDYLAKQKK